MTLQLLLSQLSIFRDAASIEDFVGAYILSSFGAILFGSILFYKNPISGESCALKGAFYVPSLISIILLALIALSTLIQGPLGPSALIFAGFFGLYIVFIPVGAIVGSVYCSYREHNS